MSLDSRKVSSGTKKQTKGKQTKSGSAKSSQGSSSAKNSSARSKGAAAGQSVKEKRIRNEITAIIMLALGAFLVIAMHTDLAGIAGEKTANFFKGLFGLGAFVIPYLMLIYSLLMLFRRTGRWGWQNCLWMLILVLGLDLFNAGRFAYKYKFSFPGFGDIYEEGVKLDNGGLFGTYAGGGLYRTTGNAGLYIVAAVLTLIGFYLLFKGTFRIVSEKKKERIGRMAGYDYLDDMEPKRKKRKEEPVIEEPAPEIRPSGAYPPENSILTEDEMIKKIKDDQRREGFLERMGLGKSQTKTMPDKDQPPKWPKKISGKQKDILDMVWRQRTFGPSELREGYGLDGSQESLRQRRDFNRENDPMDGYRFSDYSDQNAGDDFIRRDPPKDKVLDTAEFESFIRGEEMDADRSETGKASSEPDAGRAASDGAVHTPDYVVGGSSVATTKSETENSDSDVAVTPTKRRSYKLPPIDLLKHPDIDITGSTPKEDYNKKARVLEETLKSFNVEAKVVNVISGPSVTRYEIQPAIGVKVNKITGLSDDIALNMRARSIRIEAPIPGKAAVGIEIENASKQAVTIREIIGSKEFKSNKSKLAFSVGRDIGGNPVVADIAKMPHLLIAGATGSGKSVCINTLIASILYKARPEEVKMILIDPKMVELGNYNGIPHLLIPVVTDASKAASALNWAVAEMTDRYKKFYTNGVRDIGSYNALMKEQGKKEEILSQIVIIIDELSDLMMVASSQVEDAICRLAQLARAAGMHLVVATQRPSVDVITGLIKANIPSRIAFMVSSQIDSRTIIDMPGAEKLVGNGDMLFKPQDLNKPKRIQGPFISDDEVRKIIEYVKSQGTEAEYDKDVMEQIEKGKDFNGSGEGDELLADAVGVVVNAGQASVSMLQRRFRIGYNRAARIVDMMEERGIVGPPDGARPRQVLISEAEYENLREEGSI